MTDKIVEDFRSNKILTFKDAFVDAFSINNMDTSDHIYDHKYKMCFVVLLKNNLLELKDKHFDLTFDKNKSICAVIRGQSGRYVIDLNLVDYESGEKMYEIFVDIIKNNIELYHDFAEYIQNPNYSILMTCSIDHNFEKVHRREYVKVIKMLKIKNK